MTLLCQTICLLYYLYFLFSLELPEKKKNKNQKLPNIKHLLLHLQKKRSKEHKYLQW